ncbi:MOSC domain-containing protein [bacterium]|nr:MOSC domain-containing protein [bacterium]
MFIGKVLEINITNNHESDTVSVESIEVIKNKGIIGDRYFDDDGNNKSAITLIEQEALEAILTEYDVSLSAQESRRTILTSGVPLNHLVGKQFLLGDIVLEGFELAEPCGYLEKLTHKTDLKVSLKHRGGLRAMIKSSGTIKVGQEIKLK